MPLNITDADAFISARVIANDDWLSLAADRKTTFLNAADDALHDRYPSHTIPDNAVYVMAAALSVANNDTNKNARDGVKSLSVGKISMTFDRIGGDYFESISKQAWKDVARLINADLANLGLPRIGAGRKPLYTTL